MAIKIGSTYVSENAYAQAKAKFEGEQKSSGANRNSYLSSLQDKHSGINISSNTQPHSGDGINNISVSSKILNDMTNNSDKRMEYEALIIDLQAAGKSIASAFQQRGLKLESHGFIIGADGGVRGWGVITSGDSNEKSPFNTYLDKRDKRSWYDTIINNFINSKADRPYSKYDDNLIDYKA